MFPPAKRSKWCTKSNTDTVCDSATWSMKVPIGKYDVKLTIGDAEKKMGYSI